MQAKILVFFDDRKPHESDAYLYEVGYYDWVDSNIKLDRVQYCHRDPDGNIRVQLISEKITLQWDKAVWDALNDWLDHVSLGKNSGKWLKTKQ